MIKVIGVFSLICVLCFRVCEMSRPVLRIGGGDTPRYIKLALKEKDKYKPMPPQKKKVIKNLNMKELFDKIKAITAALNKQAKKNGFKVDYKFRIMDG